MDEELVSIATIELHRWGGGSKCLQGNLIDHCKEILVPGSLAQTKPDFFFQA